jgi:hypothetical protein
MGDTEGVLVPDDGTLYEAVLYGTELGQIGTLNPTTGAYTDGPDISGADAQILAFAPESSSPPVVPEPSSFLLLGTGFVALLGTARRKIGAAPGRALNALRRAR